NAANRLATVYQHSTFRFECEREPEIVTACADKRFLALLNQHERTIVVPLPACDIGKVAKNSGYLAQITGLAVESERSFEDVAFSRDVASVLGRRNVVSPALGDQPRIAYTLRQRHCLIRIPFNGVVITLPAGNLRSPQQQLSTAAHGTRVCLAHSCVHDLI